MSSQKEKGKETEREKERGGVWKLLKHAGRGSLVKRLCFCAERFSPGMRARRSFQVAGLLYSLRLVRQGLFEYPFMTFYIRSASGYWGAEQQKDKEKADECYF